MADPNPKKRKEQGRKGAQIARENQRRKAAQDQEHAEKIKKQGRPHKYTSGLCFAYKIALYFYTQDNTTDDNNNALPYTLTGLNIATGTDLNKYYDGSRDHINNEHVKVDQNNNYIEIDIYDTEKAFIYDCENIPELQAYICRLYDKSDYNSIHFSDIAKKARQIVEEQAEQRLYIKGRVADIFTMKSQYKWQEEQTTRHVVQIATPEDARQALEALKLLDD